MSETFTSIKGGHFASWFHLKTNDPFIFPRLFHILGVSPNNENKIKTREFSAHEIVKPHNFFSNSMCVVMPDKNHLIAPLQNLI